MVLTKGPEIFLPTTVVAYLSSSFDLFFAPLQEFLILCFVFFNLFLLELLSPEETLSLIHI